MKTAEALDECIRHLEGGGQIEECLCRYPALKGELVTLLATWQMVQRSSPEDAFFRPLSSSALKAKLVTREARGPWPASIKVAAFGAIGIVSSLVLEPNAAHCQAFSLVAGSGWLFWWMRDFLPRMLATRRSNAFG